MKRLTKDERTGATAIALVALLVCGGSLLFKHLGKKTHASPEMVRSIILACDSDASKKDSVTIPKNKKRKKKTWEEGNDTIPSKAKGSKDKASKNRKPPKKKATPSRDYLSEPL